LILAPMAGFSDQPFRRLAREFGADEVFSEMVSANALVREHPRTRNMMRLHANEKPATIQIFGADPEVMAEAALMAEATGCSFLDINMGCPARKIVKNGAGSALLDNPGLAAKIVKKVARAVKTPVSVKIRTGKNPQNKTGFNVALMAEDCGAKRISVHARSVADGFSGPVDYDFVAELKKRLSVEVIGNGGIKSPGDAREWINRTDCDGLLIGRGAIGRPSIFTAIKTGADKPGMEDCKIILRHCDLIERFYDEKRALGPMRGHLMYYSKGLQTAGKFRKEINNAQTFGELKRIIRKHFENQMESAA